jgi:molybdopterin-containing oxidoreductase family iron-sulfur binding subunit
MAVDAETIRQHLASARGPRLWRGLEELVQTEEFQDYVRREFPEQAAEWADPVTRRQFLTLMGASLALAGLAGCSTQPAPREPILPYVRQPEDLVLGKPLFYATAMSLSGVATGILVETHEGRPTKIEGNPEHPASLGATDLFTQASILGLYDPDRSQSVTYRGLDRSWPEALSALKKNAETLRKRKGAGLRILTETVASPTLGGQLRQLEKDFPEARWYQYEPVGHQSALEGSRIAFGEYAGVRYDMSKADVIVSLDADFLSAGFPGTLVYSRQWSRRRRVRDVKDRDARAEMNRLYMVECSLSNTGAVADHRLALRPSQIETFARALAAELQVKEAPAAGDLPAEARTWVKAVADDLRDVQKKGRHSLLLVGGNQPASLHALALAINEHLGNHGQTLLTSETLEVRPVDPNEQMRSLVRELNTGRDVEMLVILGGNPVYNAPADLDFEGALNRMKGNRFHLGLHQDETAIHCDWHIPETHYLEAWSDARAYDGTVTIQQPLIGPLYGGHSAHEVLAVFTEYPERTSRDIVTAYWEDWHRRQGGSDSFDTFWQRTLRRGLVEKSELPARRRTVTAGWGRRAEQAAVKLEDRGLEISFRPDPTIHDGRFANNGWLQELPKPVTKLTWDNAAIVSPRTAKEKLGISFLKGSTVPFGSNGGEHGQAEVEKVRINYRGGFLEVPVWIQPGHADDAVTLHLGYGRSSAGNVGNGAGFSAYILRMSDRPWFDSGVEVSKLDERYTLACTQMHHSMEDRRPVRKGTLQEFNDNHDFARVEHPPEKDSRFEPLTLYTDAKREFPYEGKDEYGQTRYRWGMAIDLTVCTGCTACVAACQAENNIPVVGKTEVTRGREMHWLRIDRYYEGDPTDSTHLSVYFQPVPCMHCENAPCELVCPVGATVHSHDGLNDMVYNRCVGTRYCSNNCPYKVRRFNFLQYADFDKYPSLKPMRNPDVTVRSRGVMEKCTYCVQRIRKAEIEAEKEDRRIEDRHLMTACQATCPTSAIVFGDMNNTHSAVRALKDSPLDYSLLEELNTRPRTTYLAAVRNPNPALEKK